MATRQHPSASAVTRVEAHLCLHPGGAEPSMSRRGDHEESVARVKNTLVHEYSSDKLLSFWTRQCLFRKIVRSLRSGHRETVCFYNMMKMMEAGWGSSFLAGVAAALFGDEHPERHSGRFREEHVELSIQSFDERGGVDDRLAAAFPHSFDDTATSSFKGKAIRRKRVSVWSSGEILAASAPHMDCGADATVVRLFVSRWEGSSAPNKDGSTNCTAAARNDDNSAIGSSSSLADCTTATLQEGVLTVIFLNNAPDVHLKLLLAELSCPLKKSAVAANLKRRTELNQWLTDTLLLGNEKMMVSSGRSHASAPASRTASKSNPHAVLDEGAEHLPHEEHFPGASDDQELIVTNMQLDLMNAQVAGSASSASNLHRIEEVRLAGVESSQDGGSKERLMGSPSAGSTSSSAWSSAKHNSKCKGDKRNRLSDASSLASSSVCRVNAKILAPRRAPVPASGGAAGAMKVKMPHRIHFVIGAQGLADSRQLANAFATLPSGSALRAPVVMSPGTTTAQRPEINARIKGENRKSTFTAVPGASSVVVLGASSSASGFPPLLPTPRDKSRLSSDGAGAAKKKNSETITAEQRICHFARERERFLLSARTNLGRGTGGRSLARREEEITKGAAPQNAFLRQSAVLRERKTREVYLARVAKEILLDAADAGGGSDSGRRGEENQDPVSEVWPSLVGGEILFPRIVDPPSFRDVGTIRPPASLEQVLEEEKHEVENGTEFDTSDHLTKRREEQHSYPYHYDLVGSDHDEAEDEQSEEGGEAEAEAPEDDQIGYSRLSSLSKNMASLDAMFGDYLGHASPAQVDDVDLAEVLPMVDIV
eukprot:CAMPEP_0178983732 /NCGR_PEP_ID=MMETSP0795-20121207/1221_1 /TAXON_ID=88552 /ORGANISM="Amoebophrya sp., Strain Ameob2" /LENGTH=824 /DNA_ID=CAMNT_0020674533 /DNA_START=28 /DNA_END=2502 /DNA_ORIENTATION=-